MQKKKIKKLQDSVWRMSQAVISTMDRDSTRVQWPQSANRGSYHNDNGKLAVDYNGTHNDMETVGFEAKGGCIVAVTLSLERNI